MMQPTSCPRPTPLLTCSPIRSKTSPPLSIWWTSAGNWDRTFHFFHMGAELCGILFICAFPTSVNLAKYSWSMHFFYAPVSTVFHLGHWFTSHYNIRNSHPYFVSQLEWKLFFPCFHSELLLNKHMEYFHSWMYPLSHELILHSIRNPLVSGFYKLLSVTMKIAKRIKYYQVGFLFLGYLKNEFCQLLMKQEYQVVFHHVL